jgi:thiol peroxidase
MEIPIMFLILVSVSLFLLCSCSNQSEPLSEHPDIVTMQGKPVTLLGNRLQFGDKAPDFKVVSNDLSDISFSSFKGKVCLISVVPSLDTEVCNIQTLRFNEEAAKLNKDVIILTISMDLPFAQKRWCGTGGIERVTTLSDYHYGMFGRNYGVLIKELHLLTRSIFVVDTQGTIKHIELVKEITQEPDYDAALKAVKDLL